ncbi:hypothetical protein D3C87_1746210 [compost metagenome]
MANFIYYGFFIFLNLFLFLFLFKKNLLNRSGNLIIATIFILIYITHQLNFFAHQINPLDFRKICFFSIILLFWFYLNSFILKQMEYKKDSLNCFNKYIYTFLQKGFFISLISIMITIIQLDWVSRIH